MEYDKYPKFPSHTAKYAAPAYTPKVCNAPVAQAPAYPMHCPYHHGYHGAYTPLGAILVLFILLVIVSRCWK